MCFSSPPPAQIVMQPQKRYVSELEAQQAAVEQDLANRKKKKGFSGHVLARKNSLKKTSSPKQTTIGA